MPLNPYEPPVPVTLEESTNQITLAKYVSSVDEWLIVSMPLAALCGVVVNPMIQLLLDVVHVFQTQRPAEATFPSTTNAFLAAFEHYGMDGGMIGCYSGLFCRPLMWRLRKKNLLDSTVGGLCTAVCIIFIVQVLNWGPIWLDDAISKFMASAIAAWAVLWFFGYEMKQLPTRTIGLPPTD